MLLFFTHSRFADWIFSNLISSSELPSGRGISLGSPFGLLSEFTKRQQVKVIYEKKEKQRDVNIYPFKFNNDHKVRGGEFEVNDYVWVLNSFVIEKLQNLNYKVKRADGKKKILIHNKRGNIVPQRDGEGDRSLKRIIWNQL